jgi:hypothetical protein
MNNMAMACDAPSRPRKSANTPRSTLHTSASATSSPSHKGSDATTAAARCWISGAIRTIDHCPACGTLQVLMDSNYMIVAKNVETAAICAHAYAERAAMLRAAREALHTGAFLERTRGTSAS